MRRTALALALSLLVGLPLQAQQPTRIGDAAMALNAEAAAELLKRAEAFPNQVVGVYLTDVTVDASGRAAPAHFREEFRTRGPSNYPQHGRQAESNADV